MITQARIREDLKETAGVDWITALRSSQIRKLVNQSYIQLSLFDEKDLAEITCEDYPGERLVACRNPFLAAERKRNREELLQATEQKLDKIVSATSRLRCPLRGEAEIGLKVGEVINKYGVAKHFLAPNNSRQLFLPKKPRKYRGRSHKGFDRFYQISLTHMDYIYSSKYCYIKVSAICSQP